MDWNISGRKAKVKTSKKAFKATLAMSEDFPMKVKSLKLKPIVFDDEVDLIHTQHSVSLSPSFYISFCSIFIVHTHWTELKCRFRLKVDMLMAVLEVIAPQFKHFGKLREFIDRKLPPGFPIQV